MEKMKKVLNILRAIADGSEKLKKHFATPNEYRTAEDVFIELVKTGNAETISTKVAKWYGSYGFTVEPKGIGYCIMQN